MEECGRLVAVTCAADRLILRPGFMGGIFSDEDGQPEKCRDAARSSRLSENGVVSRHLDRDIPVCSKDILIRLAANPYPLHFGPPRLIGLSDGLIAVS